MGSACSKTAVSVSPLSLNEMDTVAEELFDVHKRHFNLDRLGCHLVVRAPEGGYVLLKERPEKPYALPGGKCDLRDVGPRQALRREIMEEVRWVYSVSQFRIIAITSEAPQPIPTNANKVSAWYNALRSIDREKCYTSILYTVDNVPNWKGCDIAASSNLKDLEPHVRRHLDALSVKKVRFATSTAASGSR